MSTDEEASAHWWNVQSYIRETATYDPALANLLSDGFEAVKRKEKRSKQKLDLLEQILDILQAFHGQLVEDNDPSCEEKEE